MINSGLGERMGGREDVGVGKPFLCIVISNACLRHNSGVSGRSACQVYTWTAFDFAHCVNRNQGLWLVESENKLLGGLFRGAIRLRKKTVVKQ